MLRIVAVVVCAGAAFAQPADQTELSALTRELQQALARSDFVAAEELALKLDGEVQQRYKATLLADAAEQVRKALGWLPPETESLLVLQEPFAIAAGETRERFDGRPAQFYMFQRLLAAGPMVSALQGRIVRLAIAGFGHMQTENPRAHSTPARMPRADEVYFYRFTQDLEVRSMGASEDELEGRPLWRSVTRPYGERAEQVESWFALPESDLLVTASSRDCLVGVLRRMASATPGRVLPESLPEWKLVDRRAPFWGLRHFSDPGSRADVSNPRSGENAADAEDPAAVGVAVGFDSNTDLLEFQYSTGGAKLPRTLEQLRPADFQTDHQEGGPWRFKSNIRERGEFPFHVAAGLLGVGLLW